MDTGMEENAGLVLVCSCGAHMLVPSAHVGRTGRCKRCASWVRVTRENTRPATPAEAALAVSSGNLPSPQQLVGIPSVLPPTGPTTVQTPSPTARSPFPSPPIPEPVVTAPRTPSQDEITTGRRSAVIAAGVLVALLAVLGAFLVPRVRRGQASRPPAANTVARAPEAPLALPASPTPLPPSEPPATTGSEEVQIPQAESELPLLTPAADSRETADGIDSFEGHLAPFWSYAYAGTAREATVWGVAGVTDGKARTGSRSVLLAQKIGGGGRSYAHKFPEPFQGQVSIWLLFPNPSDDGGWDGSCAAFFQVLSGAGGGDFTLTMVGDNTGAWVGHRLWQIGPGWHQIRIEVGPGGARGWVDDRPYPETKPRLTNCARVAFGIDWNHGGAVCFDDYSSTRSGSASW